MSIDEKIEELEAVTDNLLVQSALSIAKQGAMLQMTLGIYKETLDEDHYKSTALQFINLWEKYCLDSLDGLEAIVSDSGLIHRQRVEMKANIQEMKRSFLS